MATNKVNNAIEALNKTIGSPIFKIGDQGLASCSALPSGLYGLDLALGVGGFPRGRLGEIYGEESSGKSLVTLAAIAETQRRGGLCALIDAEFSFDPIWASKLGVNVDDLIIQQPECGEDGLKAVDGLVRTGEVSLIVVDSVANLVPKKELEGEIDKDNVGLQARMMAKGLRRITSAISQTDTVVIFINQVRDKIGVMFGNPTTTPGGRSLKFYSSFRISMRKKGNFTEGDTRVGHTVVATVSKNKVAPPYRKTEFDVYYATGIDTTSELFLVARKLEILEREKKTYRYKDFKWVGKNKVQEDIKNNPDLVAALEEDVRKKMEELRTVS